MRPSISKKIRQKVTDRAGHRCEYCLISQEDSFLTHEIDHIISLKHKGEHHKSNFALACFSCNRNKGSDIGTRIPPDDFVRLFHPRADHWHEHFVLDGAQVLALSNVGEATIQVLQMNHPDRILERRELIAIGRYPGEKEIEE